MFNQKRIFKITYIFDISAAGLLQNAVKTVRVQWLHEKSWMIYFKQVMFLAAALNNLSKGFGYFPVRYQALRSISSKVFSEYDVICSAGCFRWTV